MRVLISGYYGFGNFGDEAVLEAISLGLRRRSPSIQVSVLRQRTSRCPTFLREILRADVFISGGGTLFQDVTSNRSFWYYIGLTWLAKLLGKRVMIMGQGFGPLRSSVNRWVVKQVLERVDLITLRDEDSAKQLKGLGVNKPPIRVTADPSFLLRQPAAGLAEPLVGVAIRAGLDERSAASLAQTLDQLNSKYGLKPIFLLLHFPADQAAADKLIKLMRTKTLIVHRPEELRALFPRLSLLIGMRLHSLIFAAMHQVPMLGISYDPKVMSFMKTIGQPCVDLETPHLSAAFPDLLGDILSEKESIKKALGKTTEELYNKAELNFELFFERFGGGDEGE